MTLEVTGADEHVKYTAMAYSDHFGLRLTEANTQPAILGCFSRDGNAADMPASIS